MPGENPPELHSVPPGRAPHARGCCLPLSSLPLPVPAVLLPGSAAGTRTGACGTHHSSHRVKWLACLLVRKGQERNGSISQQFIQQNHGEVPGTETAASHRCSPEPQWAQTDPEAPPNQAAGDERVIAQPWPFPNHRPCVCT